MSNKNKTNSFAMNNTTSTVDTNWDIDKYRDEHECEEHWQLRKAFMEKWKNNFPEDRLICLARVYTNIEFMGCRYPAPVMQQIAQLSFEGGQKYKDKKKTKLQRTFVSASTAAEDRARGIKRVGGEIVTDDKPKSSRIAFVAQGETPDNVEEKNVSDGEGMLFLRRGTSRSSVTPGSPIANTASSSASMGLTMDNSMAQLQSCDKQRVLALTGTSTDPFSHTQVNTIPGLSFTAQTPMLVNTSTMFPTIHFPPPMAPLIFSPEFAFMGLAGAVNWTEYAFAHAWQVQNHCIQSQYSLPTQICNDNPPEPSSPTECQRMVQLSNLQALNAARKKLQAETGMSRPEPSQLPARTVETQQTTSKSPSGPSFATETMTLGNSSTRFPLIHLPFPTVPEAIPPQLPVTDQTNFTKHTLPNACREPNHNGQGKCTPQTQSHYNGPSGASAPVGCKIKALPTKRERRQARKAAKKQAKASMNLSRISQLPIEGLAQQTATKKRLDRKAKRALIKASKLHGQPQRPGIDQPKCHAQTSSTQTSTAALNVAVTCGRTGTITKDVSDQVVAAIQKQILLEAFSPNQDTTRPTFKTKPVFADGVLKLWCENDHTLAWLRKTVFSLSFPNTLLVIKSQSKIQKRVRCGLVIPDDQGVFKEPTHITSVLSYQNTWVDIKKWILRKAINQVTAWFVVFAVPEAHIPSIMKAERRLAFGVGSVYVKFSDGKGKFIEIPPRWDFAKQCISRVAIRKPITKAEVTVSPTNIASGAKVAAAECTANKSIVLSSNDSGNVITEQQFERGEEGATSGGVPFSTL